MKVTCADLATIISRHSEIEFQVLGDTEYSFCCMGNMSDAGDDRAKEPYWFGLTPDGKQAYEYKTFDELLHAPVFHGQSLQSILDKVDIISIDACDPEEMYHPDHN